MVKDDSFSRCKESMIWVHRHLNGLALADTCKRSHLSGGCFHACIEHGMAILVLVGEGLSGSALALMRLQFEAYVRGIWLAHCACDDEIDKAGQDKFPKIDRMIVDLEMPGMLDSSILSTIKSGGWHALNSLTHTGYQQIGSRLTRDCIGSYFDDDQVRKALHWAEALTILGAVGFAGLAKDDQLALALLDRARLVADSRNPETSGVD